MSRLSVEVRYGFENPFVPDPLLKKALRYCRGEKVLDVGCGEGADSAYFAKKGFNVTAIDRNDEHLSRFRKYKRENNLPSITIRQQDVRTFGFPANMYDVISSLLVVCCMKRSEFGKTSDKIKRSVKRGGIVIMSSRNYLDPELQDYADKQRMIEPNTFQSKDGCCKFVYFIEKGRLREMFDDFEVLYYFEGYKPCKYHEHPRHGDSLLICRRPA